MNNAKRAGAAAPISTAGIARLVDPYVLGRREWDERYGELVKRAANWRMAAFLSMVAAIVAIFGIVVVSSRAHLVPYVVAVNQFGRVEGQGVVTESPAGTNDPRILKASLNDFVISLRQVSADGQVERTAISKVYAMLAASSPAHRMVDDYYRSNSPFERMEKGHVDVEVSTILPVSRNTYEVSWREKVYAREGTFLENQSKFYKGTFSVVVAPSKDERISRLNPIGVFVTNLEWTEDFVMNGALSAPENGAKQ